MKLDHSTFFSGKSHRVRSIVASAALPALLGLIVLPLEVMAIDGRVEVRGARRGGVISGLDFTTTTLNEDYQVGQRIGLAPRLLLQTGYLARRENIKSSGAGLDSETERVSLVPSLSLAYQTGWLRCGAGGDGFRKDEFFQGGTSRRDDRLNYSIWARSDAGKVNVDTRWQETRAWRHETLADSELQDRSFNLTAAYRNARAGNLTYQFSDTDHENVLQESANRFRTHDLSYSGSSGFAGDRGRSSIQLRTTHFQQRNIYREGTSRQLLVPLWAGYLLDDTPETWDPLEDDPQQVASLADNDRLGSTGINLGDDAPTVREFGGDFRNLIFDFGEAEPIIGATLYVDRILDFPELMTWAAYATNDPEGREYGGALGGVAAVYREFPTGEQGWEFTFAEPVSARFIKFVDTKLGQTGPGIFVTELEVYRAATTSETRQTTRRHRLIGELGYDLRTNLDVSYNTDISLQEFEDSARDLNGQYHIFGARWRPGTWSLSGRYMINKLTRDGRASTDATSEQLSLASDQARKGRLRLSWLRTDDRSAGRNQTTDNYTLQGSWDLFPDLEIVQQMGYGSRDFQLEDTGSSTWFTTTSVRGSPRRSVQVDLRRTDRWVTEQTGGSGFTEFNQTEGILSWALLPLLRWSSLARYQQRGGDSDWVLRNSLSWSPLPGGRLVPQFYLNDYQDTATEIIQRGGGANLTWRATGRLLLEGGAEWQYTRQLGQRSTPVNLHFRGNWTF